MILKQLVPPFLRPLAQELRFRLLRNPAEEALSQEVQDLRQQWHTVMNNSRALLDRLASIPPNKHVLFVTGYGVGTHFLTIEPIIAMALYSRGCRISALHCSKSLPSCEFNPVGNNSPKAPHELVRGMSDASVCFRCNKCRANVNDTYALFPFDLHGNDEYLTSSDYQTAHSIAQTVPFEEFRQFVYDGVKVGEEAFASILRATFMGEVQDTPLNRLLVKRFVMSGILTATAYERAYKALKPDRVVCIHGIYQTHGLAVKVANKLGIPVVVLGGGGIRKDTVLVCHHETYHHQLVNEDNSVWKQFALSDAEKQKTFDYAVKKRYSGSGADYLSYHPNPIEDVESLYKECGIDNTRKIVSLFTNVIWDAQIVYEGNAFKDIYDWIVTSINELGKNSNIWVVIRIHPAETKGGNPTRQPMLAEIQKRFPRLPDNVRIITPESDISSYTLARESVANIIYGTKMGLEIALMKKALIVCGETFSRNKGYGLDITSKEQYADLAANIHNYSVDVDEKLQVALQYAHYFYFRKMVDLPFETNAAEKAGSGKRLKFSSLDEISQNRHPGLDMICRGIIELKPFYMGAE